MTITTPTLDAVAHRKCFTPDPLEFLSKSLAKLYSHWVMLTYPFACKARKLSMHYSCDLSRSKAHRIKLGNSVEIRKDAIVRVVPALEQDEEPIIVIDDKSVVGFRCSIIAKNYIHIERDVMMAQSVLITDHGYACDDGISPICARDIRDGGRIRIGQGSWIGHGAAIVCTRGELVLGRNCVVGVNAVVTRSFPPHSVIFGNPARVIKQFDPATNAWVLGSVELKKAEVTK